MASTTSASLNSVKESSVATPSLTSAQEYNLAKDLTAAHARIAQLETALAEAMSVSDKKRKTTSDTTTTPSTKKLKSAVATVSPTQEPAPLSIKITKQKLIQDMKNALKGVKFYDGWMDYTPRTISVNDFVTFPEFQAIFGDYGTLVQPTLDNKPNSKVWIKDLRDADMQAALGMDETLQAELWTKGGKPLWGGALTKSFKIRGGCKVSILSAQVKYSLASAKLHLKVTLLNMGDEEYSSEEDC